MAENDERPMSERAAVISARLNRLYEIMAIGGARVSDKKVAGALHEMLRERPGRHNSWNWNYIYSLRIGRRDNPSAEILEDLGDLWGVPAAWFTDPDPDPEIERRVWLNHMAGLPGTMKLLRRCENLSSDAMELVASFIDQVRRYEKLPPVGDGS